MKKLETLFLAFFAAAFLVACSDDDGNGGGNETPDPTAEELEMAAADRFFAANSVIRALALCDTLPDNWESCTFEPQEGMAINEANPDIRYMVSSGVEYARQYFLSIVPDDGLNGDTWSHEGVGTLTFKAVNEDDCFAVINVNLLQMPNLTQLRFVPEEMVGDNKFYGEGFYKMGDVVVDSKGRSWICIRPSGGPDGKRHAYFVSFDKSLIKTKTVKHTIYDVDYAGRLTKNENKDLSGTWTFATNLVEERIAIAAAHAFTMLVWGDQINHEHGKAFGNKGDYLEKNNLFQPRMLNSLLRLLGGTSSPVFCIPYGSYKSYKHAEVTQVKNIQPTLLFYMNHDNKHQHLVATQYVLKTWPSATNRDVPQKYVYTLTSDYDPLAYHVFNPNAWDGKTSGYAKCFNIMDYTTEHLPNMDQNMIPTKMRFCNGRSDFQSALPLLMTQKCITDEGKKFSGFTLLSNFNETPKYWEILNHITRVVYEPTSWGNSYLPYD